MKDRYCYWSVVDGPYAPMMASVVESARRVGVFKEFHVWTNEPVAGAVCHRVKRFSKKNYLFKLRFLRDEVRRLPFEYFVWLDADSWFVRDPGDVLRALQGAPVHSSLESDACCPRNVRPDWWGCSLKNYAILMRFRGVHSHAIYNVNAGFWIVHRDAIDTFCDLCFDFWFFCKKAGYVFTEEAPLAYATHMLCGDPYRHSLRNLPDLWASDWTGVYQDRLPDGKPWEFVDYFSEETFPVNPAIVHAMRSKEVLVRRALAANRPGPPTRSGGARRRRSTALKVTA
ncbi:MAG TPA: hypothetical protein PLX89_20585 [Verrucomicrobiota bacterium]|nr:hypothetical protein [Verrucomicrobiota bacterium]